MMDFIEGDCREGMRQFPNDFFDSMVTDPPYELGFMGKHWDATGIVYDPSTWTESLRVLKPGGYLLAFGATRTYHRMACAIEDAGFEIRDSLSWMYATGFPKSKNLGDGVGSALKPAWEPIVMARKPFEGTLEQNHANHGVGGLNIDACRISTNDSLGGGRLTGPTDMSNTLGGPEWDRPWMHDEARRSESAAQTADKVVKAERLGRWPPNIVMQHADGCELVGMKKIASTKAHPVHSRKDQTESGYGSITQKSGEIVNYGDENGEEEVPDMRCMEGCPVAELNGQSGIRTSGYAKVLHRSTKKFGRTYGDFGGMDEPDATYGDSGGASRFFFVAKPSRKERELGCEDLPARSGAEAVGRVEGSAGIQNPRAGAGSPAGTIRNHHPTVKPIALMRHLVRLVTPPKGVVIDPFMGSGTTGCAAIMEGFDFVGMDLSAEYIEIAKRRIAYWKANP